MYNLLKILILEDTPAHQMLMSNALNKIGVTAISCVKTPGELFDHLDKHGSEINSFIIDVQLGEGQMNGIETLKEIRERGLNYPAVIVTMDTASINLKECYEYDVADIIDKQRLYTEGGFEQVVRGLMDKLLLEATKNSAGKLVPIMQKDIEFIPATDILYIQVEDDLNTVITFKGVYKTTIKKNVYTRMLEDYGFLSVSKKHLVNMSKVESLDTIEQEITFFFDPENRRLPVSEKRLPQIRSILKTRKNIIL